MWVATLDETGGMSLTLPSSLNATRFCMFQNDAHCLATSLAIFIMSTEQIIGDIDVSYLDRHRDDADLAAHHSTLPPCSSLIMRKIGRTGKRQMPHMLTCGISKHEGYRKPLAVSLVEQPCMKAHNLLEVVGEMQRNNDTAFREGHSDSNPKFTVAACPNSVYYYNNDFSARFAEWVETLKAIGFSRVHIPTADVNPGLDKLYAYYEEKGMLGFTKQYYPEPAYNEPSLKRVYKRYEAMDSRGHDPIMCTDCLLRQMHKYRFIAHLDFDEIFMILKQDSFTDWLDSAVKKQTIKSKNPPTYKFEMWPHTDDIPLASEAKTLPEYLYALRHSKMPTDRIKGVKLRHKCVYDMDTVLTVDSHDPIHCLPGKCSLRVVSRSEGHTGHFSSDRCGKPCQFPNNTEEITFLYPYKEQIQKQFSKHFKRCTFYSYDILIFFFT
ncbi:hypothetical protein SK128_027944, partial [Halocaridina rubra]